MKPSTQPFCAGRRSPSVEPPLRLQTPHPIALAVILEGNKVLLQRRRSADELAGLWEFPGGKIEPGETPEQAAARECLEELGYDVEPMQVLGSVRHDYGARRVELFAVLCRLHESHPQKPCASASFRWFEWGEMTDLPIPEANHALLRLIQSRLWTGGAE